MMTRKIFHLLSISETTLDKSYGEFILMYRVSVGHFTDTTWLLSRPCLMGRNAWCFYHFGISLYHDSYFCSYFIDIPTSWRFIILLMALFNGIVNWFYERIVVVWLCSTKWCT